MSLGAGVERSSLVRRCRKGRGLRTFFELVRRDIKTQKAFIPAQNMEFTEAEAVDFWPLYEQYEQSLDSLNDQRLGMIRKYLAMDDARTDEQARQLAADSLSLEEKRRALKRKYFEECAKVITAPPGGALLPDREPAQCGD